MEHSPLAEPVCDANGKRVLLINPPWHIQEGNIWESVASCYPSLGLAMIASYLEHCGANVRLIDMRAESGGISLLESLDEPDFIGITSTTVTIKEAYRLAGLIRAIWKNTKIIFGGVHPTIAAQEVLSTGVINYVIRGEGERSMAKLISSVSPKDIKGLSMLVDGEYWEHPEMDTIEDLNEMPLPAYHLLPMDKYRPPLGGALRQPSFSIFSARGCPGKCTFCNSALTRRTRFRSPENVVYEMKFLMDHYGIRELGFYDDTFIANKNRVRQICQLMMEQHIDLTWTCMSRINFADEITLQMMANAGCHMICYGVESADEEILKWMKKGIKLGDVEKVVRMTQKAGIRARLAFMLGNPGETVQTMKKTLQFAKDVNPDLVQFNVTTPYPGTELYAWAESNGYLLTKDWSKYDLSNMVMNLPTVSPEEVEKFYHYVHKAFYFRPSAIWKQIRYFLKHPIILAHSLPDIFDLLKTLLK